MRGEQKKNVTILNCIAQCLSFIDVALQWTDKSTPGNRTPGYLFIRHNGGFKKVAADAIKYLEASSSYCKMHLADGTAMIVSIPLSEVVKLLPDSSFIRIHRSFSVNLIYIDGFTGNTIVMNGEIKLPIGREYRKTVIRSFTFVGTKSRKYML